MYFFCNLLVILYSLKMVVKGNQIQANSSKQNNLDLLNWVPPEKFVTTFPYYLSGYDYYNRAVLVLPWGKWNPVEIIERGGQDFEDFRQRNDQLITRIKANYFRKKLNDSDMGTNDDEIAVIIDYDGFNFQQLQSEKQLAFMMNFFAKMESCYEKFAYGYMVNANSLMNEVINVGKIFMGQFMERIEVYGTNSRKFIPQILKNIPRSQLSEAYGGFKNFQPLAFYG